MSLVKLTQNGNTVYVNPDHVAIVTAHATLVNVTNVTLVNGINIQSDGAAVELAQELGYKISLV